MSIRALKVCAAGLFFWRDVPATAALVGNKRQPISIMDTLDKEGILVN